jgi:tetratricopeptide (TPR) repeat protein
MAKKIKTQPAQPIKQTPLPVVETPDPEYKPWSFYDFKVQAIIVALLAFVFYANSFYNEFAHDDGIVIVKNEYVLEGFAGIKDIMTKDAYDSYYRQLNTTNQLSGGRYRPLSIVTFAIEQQFLGPVPLDKIDSVLKQSISYGVSGPQQSKLIHAMHVRHVVSVLIYMLSVVILLYFLRYIIFKNNPLMAFIAAVLFTIHPIHTEVIANVKSRDEIMSLLFMCLTFILAFKYEEDRKKIWILICGLFSFLLAFLAKEYAITMVALLPLTFYLFRNYSIQKSISATLPYLAIVPLYMGLRMNSAAPPIDHLELDSSAVTMLTAFPTIGAIAGIVAMYFYVRKPKNPSAADPSLMKNILIFLPYFFFTGLYLFQRYKTVPPAAESSAQEVLNNPYLFAEGTQKLATEIATSLNYLKLLLFPYPLSVDYSFNTIPYVDFSNWKVWLSLLVHGGMIAAALIFFKKIITIKSQTAQNANVRLAATPSAADNGKLITYSIFLFAIAFYFLHLLLVCNIVFDIGATMGERLIYHSSVGFAIAVAWFLVKGMEKIQNQSVARASLAGVMTVITVLFAVQTMARNRAWKNDYTLFTTDIKTVPNSVLVNANVAASYITLADYQTTDSARSKYLHDAIDILNHTLHIHRTFVAGFLNRGIAWYKLGDVDKAKPNIDTVRSLYPNYPTLPGMYKLISDFYLKNGWESYGKKGMYTEAIVEYKKGLAIDPTNADLWYNMGGAYFTNKQYPDALDCFKKALQLKPNNPNAQQGISAAMQMLGQGGAPPNK